MLEPPIVNVPVELLMNVSAVMLVLRIPGMLTAPVLLSITVKVVPLVKLLMVVGPVPANDNVVNDVLAKLVTAEAVVEVPVLPIVNDVPPLEVLNVVMIEFLVPAKVKLLRA